MRTFVLVLCLTLCAVAVHAQDQQPSSAAAPAVGAVVHVHVTASRVHRCWDTGCPDTVYIEAVINGKKYELEGMASYGRKSKVPTDSVLMPGNYQAKLTKDVENGSGLFFQVYELLLPGGDTWEGTVSGVSE
jgi:hypothetical protein